MHRVKRTAGIRSVSDFSYIITTLYGCQIAAVFKSGFTNHLHAVRKDDSRHRSIILKCLRADLFNPRRYRNHAAASFIRQQNTVAHDQKISAAALFPL